MQDQVAQFTHTCSMVTPYEGYVEVCEELARRTPGTHEKRSSAVQLGRGGGRERGEDRPPLHRTDRPWSRSITPYHGRTNLAMALTAKNMPYKQGFGPFAGEVYRVPMAYPLRWPGGPEACKAEALETVSRR